MTPAPPTDELNAELAALPARLHAEIRRVVRLKKSLPVEAETLAGKLDTLEGAMLDAMYGAKRFQREMNR